MPAPGPSSRILPDSAPRSSRLRDATCLSQYASKRSSARTRSALAQLGLAMLPATRRGGILAQFRQHLAGETAVRVDAVGPFSVQVGDHVIEEYEIVGGNSRQFARIADKLANDRLERIHAARDVADLPPLQHLGFAENDFPAGHHGEELPTCAAPAGMSG